MNSVEDTLGDDRATVRRTAAPLFLTLSALLHAAVLLLSLHASPVVVVPSVPGTPGNNALQVILEQKRRTVAAKPTPQHSPAPRHTSAASEEASTADAGRVPRIRHRAKVAANARSRDAELTKAVSGRAKRNVRKETATPRGAEPAQSQETHARAEVLAAVQENLASHFVYPMLARRRGWQGTVVVAFQVDPEGKISNSRIARSSGVGLLDRAALQSLRRIGQLHGVKGMLGERNIDLELPVIYRLRGTSGNPTG